MTVYEGKCRSETGFLFPDVGLDANIVAEIRLVSLACARSPKETRFLTQNFG